MTDINGVIAYLSDGMLTRLPSKKKKKLAALVWLAEHIPSEKEYTEQEFNELLNRLHSFHDPAALRRELYNCFLIDRSPDGNVYRLNPARPSLEELLAKYCGGTGKKAEQAGPESAAGNDADRTCADYSDRDLAGAEDFRNRIHAEALKRVRRIRPEISSVVDRYPVEEYFQQVWDYPGAWYTVVAIPARAGSREALIDTIVRDTLKLLSK